jgi:hypothetical protein
MCDSAGETYRRISLEPVEASSAMLLTLVKFRAPLGRLAPIGVGGTLEHLIQD